jgi:hypothetical protein
LPLTTDLKCDTARCGRSKFEALGRKMKNVQNRVEEEGIEKRITEEQGPPPVGTSAPGVNAYEREKVRDYESGERKGVDNPVAK